MKTAFYILFKEYSDSSRSPSALYIKDNTETDPEQIVKEVNEWLKIAHFFKYERCDRYYDSENMKGVLYPYIALQEEYEEEEYPNITVVIQALLNEEGFVDWRDEPLESGEQYSLNNQDVTNNCLGEMARNEAQGNAVVLLNCNAFHFRSPIVLSVNPTGNNVSIYWYNDIRSVCL